MAQEYFELANVLDGSMTPEEARNYYTKSIGDLYGVGVLTAEDAAGCYTKTMEDLHYDPKCIYLI